VGVQLAKKLCWVGKDYIHLTYAGVTAAARGKKVLTRLIAAEKGRGLALVTQVKPDNKSDMVARLKCYGFQPWPWSDPPSPLQLCLPVGPGDDQRMLGVIKEHDPGNDVGGNTRQLQGTRGACGNALDVVARVRAPRRPHADARLRGDARGRDGGAHEELANEG
jgi:hypothetical protein